VEDHVINTIHLNQDLSSRLTGLTGSSQVNMFLQLYHDAAGRLGSSTKRAVIAVDPVRNIVIDGVFLAHSSTSDFYYAYEDGKPYLLKLSKQPEAAAALQREAAAYERVKKAMEEANQKAAVQEQDADQTQHLALFQTLSRGFRFLVPVELIQLIDPRPQQLSSSPSPDANPQYRQPPGSRILALKMPVFVGTLQECPSDVRLAQLYCNAGNAIFHAMTALHSAGLVHCDIKPSNIFIDSNGQCLLGDYDAVTSVDQPVCRSTPDYLPEPLRSLFSQRTVDGHTALSASPAVDFAMLSFTLLASLGYTLSPELQLEHTIVQLTEQLQRDRSNRTSKVQQSIQAFQERILRQLQHCAREMRTKHK